MINFFKANNSKSTEHTIREAWKYLSIDSFDFKEAKKLLLMIPDANIKFKAYELYKLLNEGENRDFLINNEDYEQSNAYLKLAAKSGNIQACYELAIRLLEDVSNRATSYEYMLMAGNFGHSCARQIIAEYGQNLPSALELAASGLLNSDECESEENETREMYYSFELAELGVAVRASMVGDYFNKRENFEDAVIWYEKAADAGDQNGMFNCLTLHADKDLINPKYDKVLRFAETLFMGRDPEAMHAAAKIYLKSGTFSLAIAHFKLAAHYAKSNSLKQEESFYARKYESNMSDEDKKVCDGAFKHFCRLIGEA